MSAPRDNQRERKAFFEHAERIEDKITSEALSEEMADAYIAVYMMRAVSVSSVSRSPRAFTSTHMQEAFTALGIDMLEILRNLAVEQEANIVMQVRTPHADVVEAVRQLELAIDVATTKERELRAQLLERFGVTRG